MHAYRYATPTILLHWLMLIPIFVLPMFLFTPDGRRSGMAPFDAARLGVRGFFDMNIARDTRRVAFEDGAAALETVRIESARDISEGALKVVVTLRFDQPGDAQLIDIARRSVPPMQEPRVRSVRIYRSGLCGGPHLYVGLEDDRANADVEFDARERRVDARIR